jgi:chromosomal replication initiation ATPase DnaA
VGGESFRNPIRTPDLETRVAILRKRAEQEKVILPEDVALYIAQNFRSNASALGGALIRLLAHSRLIGTDITLNYAKQVLKNFIDLQARKATVDPFQKMSLGQRSTKEADVTRQAPTATDRSFVFCLLKAQEGGKISRVRQEFEVNMREREREQLARRDAYERELERRAKKRKRG